MPQNLTDKVMFAKEANEKTVLEDNLRFFICVGYYINLLLLDCTSCQSSYICVSVQGRLGTLNVRISKLRLFIRALDIYTQQIISSYIFCKLSSLLVIIDISSSSFFRNYICFFSCLCLSTTALDMVTQLCSRTVSLQVQGLRLATVPYFSNSWLTILPTYMKVNILSIKEFSGLPVQSTRDDLR